MWSVDTRCARCTKRSDCPDRSELYKTLSPLTNKLNIEEPFVSGPGDGIIIISCNDFSQE